MPRRRATPELPELAADFLTELEALTELALPAADVAVVLGLTPLELADLLDRSPDARQAADRGRLKAQAAVHKAVLTMARQGSAPAQALYLKLNDRRERLDVLARVRARRR